MTPPSDAAEILKLIENVDPSDDAMMDEIDARVWCYLNDKRYLSNREMIGGNCVLYGSDRDYHSPVAPYSRSRDALKAIRPAGYMWEVGSLNDRIKFHCHMRNFPSDGETLFSRHTFGPTEELAELHAIIQSIAHERTKQ